MWKSWYELTHEQKAQARDLDNEVRMYPSEFEYFVDDETEKITDYERIIK